MKTCFACSMPCVAAKARTTRTFAAEKHMKNNSIKLGNKTARFIKLFPLRQLKVTLRNQIYNEKDTDKIPGWFIQMWFWCAAWCGTRSTLVILLCDKQEQLRWWFWRILFLCISERRNLQLLHKKHLVQTHQKCRPANHRYKHLHELFALTKNATFGDNVTMIAAC